MNLSEILDASIKYGLGIVLSVGAVYGLWRITARSMEDSTKREERYASLVENHINALQQLLTAHDQRAISSIQGMVETQRYQREEHSKILEGLTEVVILLKALNGRRT